MTRGWFADRDDSAAPHNWAAFLQLDGMCLRLDGAWFSSEQDCAEFIRTDILGKGELW